MDFHDLTELELLVSDITSVGQVGCRAGPGCRGSTGHNARRGGNSPSESLLRLVLQLSQRPQGSPAGSPRLGPRWSRHRLLQSYSLELAAPGRRRGRADTGRRGGMSRSSYPPADTAARTWRVRRRARRARLPGNTFPTTQESSSEGRRGHQACRPPGLGRTPSTSSPMWTLSMISCWPARKCTTPKRRRACERSARQSIRP
jgi:hypothetical protein